MGEIKAEEVLASIRIADADRVRARNYVIGRLAFTGSEPDKAKYPDAAEALRALGLAWRKPPGTLPIKELPPSLDLDPKQRGLQRNAVR